MSRSYRKPVSKMNQVTEFKKLYNRKNRRSKMVIVGGNYYKKLNNKYNICDYNAGIIDNDKIEKWYSGKEYKIRRK